MYCQQVPREVLSKSHSRAKIKDPISPLNPLMVPMCDNYTPLHGAIPKYGSW